MFSYSLNPDSEKLITDKFPVSPPYKELYVYEIVEGDLKLKESHVQSQDKEIRDATLFDSNQRLRSWEYIKHIYPIRYLNKINKMIILNDGFGGKMIDLSANSVDRNDKEKWTMALDPEDMNVNINGTDSVDKDAVIYELGHLISIDSSQVNFDKELIASQGENYNKLFNQKQNECLTYLVSEGCLKEDSYIFKLYEKFWKGEVFDEFTRIQSIEDKEEFNLEIENFEKKYTDQFVTYIAALSPESDFAMLWTFYVYDYPVEGKVKEHKIRFISEFPELVKLKEEVLNNLKLLEKENGSFN
jgi:hypothetical protein